MRGPWRRRPRRFDRPKEIDDDAILVKLLDGVWDLPWDSHGARFPPGPYVDYWTDLVQLANNKELSLRSTDLVIALVSILRDGLDTDLHDLRTQLQQHYKTKNIRPSISPEAATVALEFTIRLWAHVHPNLSHHSLPGGTLKDLIHGQLPERISDHLAVEGRLSDDFCAKHLWRKAGMRVVWTDNLKEHLTMIRQDRLIYCFRHSAVLNAFVHNPRGDPFPTNFAQETLETLTLLFRPLNPSKTRYRVRRMEKHLDVDIELAMLRHGSSDLAAYRYWGTRLRDIQAAYDRKTPSSLSQWWFDRRDRSKWISFWVATVVVVGVTVMFGVIQCVTGILQVWAAFHPVGR